jgi:hypothetical protein
MAGLPLEKIILDATFRRLSRSLSEVSKYVWPPKPPSPSYGKSTKAALLASGMKLDPWHSDFFIPAAQLYDNTDVRIPDQVTIDQLQTCSGIFEHLIKRAADQTEPGLSLKLINGWHLGDDASLSHVRGMTLRFEISQSPHGDSTVQWIEGIDMANQACRKLWPYTADFGFSKLAEMPAEVEQGLERSIGASMQSLGPSSGGCGDFTWDSNLNPGESGPDSMTYKLVISHTRR